MQINIPKLKGKMAENNINRTQLASKIGMARTTFYRKLKSGGGSFTVEEVQGIASALNMTPDEVTNIFLGKLSDDERELLEKFRLMSEAAKMKFVRALAASVAEQESRAVTVRKIRMAKYAAAFRANVQETPHGEIIEPPKVKEE